MNSSTIEVLILPALRGACLGLAEGFLILYAMALLDLALGRIIGWIIGRVRSCRIGHDTPSSIRSRGRIDPRIAHRPRLLRDL
ncbi:hypothetical protein P12x_000363 [Tundrisphaera lichenicola]|uniref:hypothetical protein n=1 Tax=Tundrisphaera lichenicola TaxID=2029860 RepID=UPI003EBB340D